MTHDGTHVTGYDASDDGVTVDRDGDTITLHLGADDNGVEHTVEMSPNDASHMIAGLAAVLR